MNPFSYTIAREIVIALSGGSLPQEALDNPPSPDPMGDLNTASTTASVEFLNSLSLPGIPEFRMG